MSNRTEIRIAKKRRDRWGGTSWLHPLHLRGKSCCSMPSCGTGAESWGKPSAHKPSSGWEGGVSTTRTGLKWGTWLIIVTYCLAHLLEATARRMKVGANWRESRCIRDRKIKGLTNTAYWLSKNWACFVQITIFWCAEGCLRQVAICCSTTLVGQDQKKLTPFAICS